MKNLSFIIPSAGKSTRLFPISDGVPKVLVRLNGVPILHFFYQQALKVGADNIIIAVSPEHAGQLEEFIDNTYSKSEIPIYLEIVDKPSEGVLYSVFKATTHSEARENLLIVLSDTLYNADLPLAEKSFIVCDNVKGKLSRWCLAESNEFNLVTKFYDKPQGECPTNKALIGVYYVKRDFFNADAQSVMVCEKKVRGEFQLSQALNQYLASEDLYVLNAEPGAWHDTGTLENLKDSSINFFISRAFNNIKIKDGILIKETTQKTKLRNEYIWYTQVKNKSLIPAIYSYEETEKTSKLEMELCSLNDLGTIFNFCNSEPVFFEQAIEYILKTLHQNLYTQLLPNNVVVNRDMLGKKLSERTTQIQLDNALDMKNIGYLKSILHQEALNGIFTQIHGDLILSNILFEPQRMIIKLIDARGDYGGNGVYGDLRYDLAKLLHSLDGKYETILHNLYTIENDEVIFYMSHKKQRCFEAAIEKVYEFAAKFNISVYTLKTIEASLFYSMIPLHADDPKRQKAFLLTARRLMKEIQK